MKRFALLVCLVVGCTMHGDGQEVSESRLVDYFDAVELFNGFATEIVVDPALPLGNSMEVVVSGDANLVDHLFVGVHTGGTLSAGVDSNHLIDLELSPGLAVRIPVLVRVYAEDRTTTAVSGASGELEVEVHDQAVVTLAGSGGALKISASESARVEAQAFHATSVTVDARGTGTVFVCSDEAPVVTGDGEVVRRCD